MPTPLRQTILANIVTALKTITVAGGYEHDVGDNVYYPPRMAPTMPVTPSIVLKDLGDESRPISKAGYEHLMRLEAHCYVRDGEATTKSESILDLLHDVVDVINNDRSWTVQAVDTVVNAITANTSEAQLDEPSLYGVVSFTVLYRTTLLDPFVQRLA